MKTVNNTNTLWSLPRYIKYKACVYFPYIYIINIVVYSCVTFVGVERAYAKIYDRNVYCSRTVSRLIACSAQTSVITKPKASKKLESKSEHIVYIYRTIYNIRILYIVWPQFNNKQAKMRTTRKWQQQKQKQLKS